MVQNLHLSRPVRRKLERDAAKAPVAGFTAEQLKAFEAELASNDIDTESSHATTLAVLAHSWYALDHQREASRVTYQRTKKHQENGRDVQTAPLVKQYAEAKADIVEVEEQIRALLRLVVAEHGPDTALVLLQHTHTNMQNNITVRFPEKFMDRIAEEVGIAHEPEGDGEPSDPPGGAEE